jgi:AcrR family transcriptional regulator
VSGVEPVPTSTWRNLPAQKRERVLDAAMAEFGARGFSSASLNVVAREAGVAKGSLFAYFEDKLDLYAHVCEACSLRVREAMIAALHQRASEVGEQLFPLLRAVLVDWVEYFAGHPLERGVTLAMNFEMDPEIRPTVRAVVNHHYLEVLQPLLERAATSGELRDDVDTAHLLALLVLLLPHVALAPFTPELDPVLGMYGAGAAERSGHAQGLLDAVERAFVAAPR